MKYLLKAIKAKIAAAAPTLANRVFMGVVSEKIKLSDTPNGPYCRVVFVGQDETQYGFADYIGIDTTVIQFSVFAETLVAADSLVDQILTGFHGVSLTLDIGNPAYGRKLKRGMFVEPKSADANQVYHSWVTIQFTNEDKLS
jgi:hypothetical protein